MRVSVGACRREKGFFISNLSYRRCGRGVTLCYRRNRMDPHADSFGSCSYCICNTYSGANSNSLSELDSHSYPSPNRTPAPTAAPAATGSGTPINLDLTGEGLEEVKRAIAQRIELQPSLTQVQKDKIYNAVESARAMGRIAVVSFPTAISVPVESSAAIVAQLSTPEAR